jgi:hypothetical protein
MDNFGDYIYVLIFVAVAIFNFFNKAKKKAAESASLPQPIEYEFEEEAENHRPFEEIVKPEPVRQAEPFRQPVQQPVQPMPQRQMPAHNTPQPIRHSTPNMAIKTASEVFQPIDIDFTNTEELRKGIVFAEIFNRKYA